MNTPDAQIHALRAALHLSELQADRASEGLEGEIVRLKAEIDRLHGLLGREMELEELCAFQQARIHELEFTYENDKTTETPDNGELLRHPIENAVRP